MMETVRIGVVLAGGQGTRLGWLGKFLPKSLVPLGQKPMLYYILKNLEKMGIRKIYLLVNYKKGLIKDYLKGEDEFKKITFRFVHSQPKLGLADVIHKTKAFIKKPFIVFLGDDLTITKNISQFPKEGLRNNAIAQEAVIAEKSRKILSQTCEVFFDRQNKILKANEKPSRPTSNYRGCGLYFFRPELFEFIKKTKASKTTGKKEITDTINLIAADKRAFAWPINGINVNVNTGKDLIKATKYLFSNAQE